MGRVKGLGPGFKTTILQYLSWEMKGFFKFPSVVPTTQKKIYLFEKSVMFVTDLCLEYIILM